MDRQFDVLFAIDDDSRLTNVAHDFSIIEANQQVDSAVEYRQIIAAIEIHLAMMPPQSEIDPIDRQNREVLVQCRPI